MGDQNETCMVTYTRCCFALHLVSNAVGPFSLVGVGTEMAIVRDDTVEGGSGVLTPPPPSAPLYPPLPHPDPCQLPFPPHAVPLFRSEQLKHLKFRSVNNLALPLTTVPSEHAAQALSDSRDSCSVDNGAVGICSSSIMR